jgi:hypothetical protein
MNSRQQAKNTLNLRVKQAGQLLAQSRWTECDTRVSPAGMAGSGNVCADFWNPDNQLLPFRCAKVFAHRIVLVSSRVATEVVLHPVHEPMTPT